MVGCVCGGFLILFILVWLCLWISGTYFFVSVVKEMRIDDLIPKDQADANKVGQCSNNDNSLRSNF